ncbi:UNVERIFIED_CONTAM: hypothetical protein K2H54_062260 [Gekko kuhli]
MAVEVCWKSRADADTLTWWGKVKRTIKQFCKRAKRINLTRELREYHAAIQSGLTACWIMAAGLPYDAQQNRRSQNTIKEYQIAQRNHRRTHRMAHSRGPVIQKGEWEKDRISVDHQQLTVLRPSPEESPSSETARILEIISTFYADLYNARPTAPTPKEMEGYLMKQQTLPISFDAEELRRLVSGIFSFNDLSKGGPPHLGPKCNPPGWGEPQNDVERIPIEFNGEEKTLRHSLLQTNKGLQEDPVNLETLQTQHLTLEPLDQETPRLQGTPRLQTAEGALEQQLESSMEQILQGLLEELTSCNDSIRNLDLSILTNTDPIEFDHLTGKRMWLLTLVEIKEQEAKQQQQIIDKLTTELINLNVNVESLVSLPEYISGCTLETPAQLSEPSEEHLLEEHPVSIQNLQDFQTSHSTYPTGHLMMTPTTPQMYGGLPDTPVELSPELWPAKRPKHHDPKIPPTSNVSTIESARVTKPLQIPAYPECRNPGDQVQGDRSPQMEPDPSHPPRDQWMDGDTEKEEAPETENRGAAARTEIPMMTPEMRRAFSDNQGNPESQGSLQTSEDPGTTTKHIYSSVKRKGEGE